MEKRRRVEDMSTQTRSPAATASVRAGTLTLTLAVLFAAATAYTYLLSLVDGFDPPDWLRLAGLIWLPIGVVGIPVSYALARNGPGQDRARTGLVVALVAAVAFVVLQFAAG